MIRFFLFVIILIAAKVGFSGETRAIWLSFPYWDLKPSEKRLLGDSLSSSGFNTVYLAVYGSAKVRWESEVLTGIDLVDTMSETEFTRGVSILRNVGMRVVPWFEGGLSVYLSKGFHKKNPSLLQKCGNSYASGEYGGKVMAFLDPKNEKALMLITEALKELAKHPLGFDEIQLDRFRYTRGNNNRICKSFDGSSYPENVDEAVRLAYEAIKSINPKITVSASPVNSIGGRFYRQNWHTWAKSGYIDAISAQAYVSPVSLRACSKGSKNGLSRKASLLLFKAELAVWLKKAKNLQKDFPLTIGLMAERHDDSECVLDQMRYARKNGIKNFSIWVSQIQPKPDGTPHEDIQNNFELLKRTDWGKKK